MTYKIFIISILLLSACSKKNKINACDCMEVLLDKNTFNNNWEKCISLSKDVKFIKKMKNCNNYNNFIRNKVEENYQNLINPPQDKNIKIENITK